MYEIHSLNKKIFKTQKAHIFGIDDLISGGASLLGDIGGYLSGGTDESDQRLAALQQQIGALPTTYSPENYDTSLLSPVNYQIPDALKAQLVSDDPQTKAQAEQALGQIQNRASGVISATEQNGFDQARRMADQQAHGQSEAIMRDAMSRGTGTGGNALALQAIAAQAAADRASQSGLQTAQDMAQTQQQANAAQLQGAGQLRGQDIGLNTTNANLINQFNQYNSAVQQATKNANVQLQNQALQNQRQTQNANVAAQNQAKQQGVQNALTKAQIGAGVTNSQNANSNANSAAKSGMVQGVFGGLGQVGGGIYNAMNNQGDSPEVQRAQNATIPSAENSLQQPTMRIPRNNYWGAQ